MFTGQTIATIAPPHGQFFAGIAAAGDDRTFVLQAEVGGQTPKSPMPVNPSTAAFDELRLKADGHLESLSVLGTVPARTALSGFAISQDASMLAYFTGAGFEAVSLATGTGRHWPGGLPRKRQPAQPVLGGRPDRIVRVGAGEQPPSARTGPAGARRHRPGQPAAGFPAGRRGRAVLRRPGAGVPGPVITADGSKIMVGRSTVRGRPPTATA